jgi:hypothetical protein
VETWIYEIAELPIFKQIDLTSYIEKMDISYANIILDAKLASWSANLGIIVNKIRTNAMISNKNTSKTAFCIIY